MSQKQAKRKRREQKWAFDMAYWSWLDRKPPWFRFIARNKWKKAEPRMEDYV